MAVRILIVLILWLIVMAETAMAGPFEDHQHKAEHLSRDGDHVEALMELRAAYEIRPMPRLLYQMGQMHLHLREGRQALDAFQRYLATEPHLTPKARARIERYMGEARAMIVLELAPAPTDLKEDRISRPVPLYRRWWLWTIVGVAATGVALGAGLGTVLTDPRRNPNYREIEF